jgi:hypothetical protein
MLGFAKTAADVETNILLETKLPAYQHLDKTSNLLYRQKIPGQDYFIE